MDTTPYTFVGTVAPTEAQWNTHTTAIGQKASLADANTFLSNQTVSNATSSTSTPSILTLRKDYTGGAVATGADTGKVSFQAHNGVGYIESAFIKAVTTDTQDSTHAGTKIDFFTTLTGSAAPSATPLLSISGNNSGEIIANSANLRPSSDAGGALGSSNRRWNVVYAMQYVTAPQTLTDAATIAWVATSGAKAAITPTVAGRAMGAPSGLISGGTYILDVIEHATGTITSWNAVFKFAAATAPVIGNTAGRHNFITFTSDGTNLYEMSRALAVPA